MYGVLTKISAGVSNLEELKERCKQCHNPLFAMRWNERTAIRFCNNEICLSFRTPVGYDSTEEPVTIPEEALPPEHLLIVPPGWLSKNHPQTHRPKRRSRHHKEANNV